MVAITKLISYIIPIVVLILFLVFYYNPAGSFEKVKNVVSGIIGQVSIGAKQVLGEKPMIPADQQQAIDNLKAKIIKMHESDKNKNGCFANYNSAFSLTSTENQKQGFPPLGKTVVKFLKEGNALKITITGGVDGKQEVSSEILKDSAGNPVVLTPCVISGRGGEIIIPEKFLQKIMLKREVNENFFLPVQELVILAGGTKISYNRGANIDLEDGGFLYTPDGNHICFFPTRDGVNSCKLSDNPDGLDDECLGEGDYEFYVINDRLSSAELGSQSVAYLLNTGALTWC